MNLYLWMLVSWKFDREKDVPSPHQFSCSSDKVCSSVCCDGSRVTASVGKARQAIQECICFEGIWNLKLNGSDICTAQKDSPFLNLTSLLLHVNQAEEINYGVCKWRKKRSNSTFWKCSHMRRIGFSQLPEAVQTHMAVPFRYWLPQTNQYFTRIEMEMYSAGNEQACGDILQWSNGQSVTLHQV